MREAKRRFRYRRWLAIGLLAVCAVAAAFYVRDRQRHAANYAYSDLHWEFAERPKPWDQPTKAAYTRGCLDIARTYPQSPVAFAVIHRAIEVGDPEPAIGLFTDAVAVAPFELIATTLTVANPIYRPLSPSLLERAKGNPSHPQAPRILGIVCCLAATAPTDFPPREFVAAADELARLHLNHPATADVAKALVGPHATLPKWADSFEPRLRELITSKNDVVRRWATFAVCRILEARGRDDANVEQATLLATVADWPTQPDATGEYITGLEISRMSERLKSGVCELPAPETRGADLEGKPITLADYRGKAVLVVFWSTTCGPCLAMTPHEVELAKKYAGRPFVILGVNCDANPAKARDVATRLGMTWPSVADEFSAAKDRFRIAEVWQARGLPLVCVVDAAGVVRFRRNYKPDEAELDEAIDRQVVAAELRPLAGDDKKGP